MNSTYGVPPVNLNIDGQILKTKIIKFIREILVMNSATNYIIRKVIKAAKLVFDTNNLINKKHFQIFNKIQFDNSIVL